MKDAPKPSIVAEIFNLFLEVWKEIFGAVMAVLPKAFYLLLWVLAGIIILPCVLVANFWYPSWVEWGEEL